jgi:N-acetylneuraminic acid mutarotase
MKSAVALLAFRAVSVFGVGVLLSDTEYCWKTLAPLGEPRQEHGIVAVEDDVYLVSGLLNNVMTNRVDIYHTRNNSWSTTSPLPESYHHPNIAEVDGKIYVLGGINNATGWKSNPKSFRFDPATRKWEEVAQMPDGRGAGVVAVSGKTIYIAGGLQSYPGAAPDPESHGSKTLKPMTLLSSYDTESNSWTSYPNLSLPEARDHAGGAVIDDKLYVVAGRPADAKMNRNTVLALDLERMAGWEELAPMPTKRGGVAGGVVGKQIFIFGGEGNTQDPSFVFRDVDVYDAEADSWRSDPPMMTPRHGLGAAATVGETLYLPGGGITGGLRTPVTTNDAYGPC